jgi:hypothetical protein
MDSSATKSIGLLFYSPIVTACGDCLCEMPTDLAPGLTLLMRDGSCRHDNDE